ncbi:DUF4783 domain-containing protein [Xanthovirga aplysinae]|uniref:DUF4783 domain-containing protein n=1 Tax=Xanthovirga aplysinae TaxID=2529853 RepID=UPI001656E8F9|nr:DUF4783 domain-containing protein [Xanthovirga aplysinae]
MSNFKFIPTFFIFFVFSTFWLAFSPAQAQSGVIHNVRVAMKSGSSKELTRFFNDRIELSIDGERTNYSKVQAEFILKGFFKDFPPEDFEYIHKGASKEGLNYTIGKYVYKGGAFRVLMRVKQFNRDYLVYMISFDKE